MMPTSFLDLPLELRGEIYKLIIPNKGRANGELFSVNKIDTTYWEDDPLLDNDPPFYRHHAVPLPTVPEETLRLGARLQRTCRPVNVEAAPYVYGQQQSVSVL